MKRLFFILIGVFFIKYIEAQEPKEFWNDKCDFKTDGKGKSQGLKIKIVFPCKWKETEGERPHAVRNFGYSLLDTAAITSSLGIKKLKSIPSRKEADESLTNKELTKFGYDLGDSILSVRIIEIDGEKCGEIAIKKIKQSANFYYVTYSLWYYLIYKDYLVLISYSTSGLDDKKTLHLFEKYKFLFQSLFANTVLISKWE